MIWPDTLWANCRGDLVKKTGKISHISSIFLYLSSLRGRPAPVNFFFG